jgi:hypothetical protein
MNEISMYQIETIRKNIIRGIVRMSVSNGEIRYDTNGLKPKKRYKIPDVIKVLETIKRARRFFFYDKNFMLDEGKILFDKKNSPKLIYIPVKSHESRSMNVEAFIKNSIRIPFIRDNLIAFYNSPIDSIIEFNRNRLIYAAAVLLVSVTAALLIDTIMLLIFLPLNAAPYMKINKKEKVQTSVADDRTVILKDTEAVSVCFSDVFGNEKSICINEHEQTYVGRDKKECQLYISNNAVGRKHAKIIYTDGKIYLCDNDSLNNTYINNQKLKKQKQYEIKNGDRVRFANEEYMLFIP